MKSQDKKLLAILCSMLVLLVVTIVLSVNIYNKNKSNNDVEIFYVPGTTGSVVNTTVNSIIEPTAAQTNGTVQNNEQNNIPQVPQTNSASAVQTTAQQVTTTPAYINVSSMSSSEILAMLTTAVNKTKAYDGTVSVRHTESFTADVTECTGGSIAASVANTVIGTVVKPTDEVLSFSGRSAVNSEGESVSILLPQKGNFSLGMNGISSVSASETYNGIEVYIKLVPEKVGLYDIPQANASSIGYLDIASFDLSILEVTSADINYTGSTIKAIINSDGYIDYAEYTIPMHVEASAKSGFISGSAVFDGMQTEIWGFNW